MRMLIFLLFALDAFADVDIIVTEGGKETHYSAKETRSIRIGADVCAINYRSGNIIGKNHEPGEAGEVDCPFAITMSKSCRQMWGSEGRKAWMQGYNDDDNSTIVYVGRVAAAIRFNCSH